MKTMFLLHCQCCIKDNGQSDGHYCKTKPLQGPLVFYLSERVYYSDRLNEHYPTYYE